MEAWKQAGGKTEQGSPPAETGSFTAGPPEKAGLILFDELREAVEMAALSKSLMPERR